ncbi:unnamed protein product [Prunus armeniaca]|uniref:Uncharacterized protein n=1 Tax=Prunus armeniaca TaxID=36596 RepID=A0A6J5TN60_PRUAR|nr:unnamed protein product [Prunus armeniaca]
MRLCCSASRPRWPWVCVNLQNLGCNGDALGAVSAFVVLTDSGNSPLRLGEKSCQTTAVGPWHIPGCDSGLFVALGPLFWTCRTVKGELERRSHRSYHVPFGHWLLGCGCLRMGGAERQLGFPMTNPFSLGVLSNLLAWCA